MGRKPPLLPRRVFLAATLSAVCAGGGAALAVLGGASNVETGSFQFTRGVSFAFGEEERLRGVLGRALKDERVHVTILGHTGSAGDPAANLVLSEQRAAIAEALARDLGIAPDRMTARGLGGASPLPKEDGEGDRAYQSRLARVDVSLQLRR